MKRIEIITKAIEVSEMSELNKNLSLWISKIMYEDELKRIQLTFEHLLNANNLSKIKLDDNEFFENLSNDLFLLGVKKSLGETGQLGYVQVFPSVMFDMKKKYMIIELHELLMK